MVDHDREANGQALVNLKEHMERENEILWCADISSFLAPRGALEVAIYNLTICLSVNLSLLALFQLSFTLLIVRL